MNGESRNGDAVVIEILGMMHSLNNNFNGHAGKLLEIDHKIDTILSAFPDGGLVAHRLSHERMMASDKSAANLREGVSRNIVSGGAWATIVIVAYALWEYFKIKVRA